MSDKQWRAVLRQLIALGYVQTEGEFHTLELTETAREVLKGKVQLTMRQTVERQRGARKKGASWHTPAARRVSEPEVAARLDALKAWRTNIAREHNLPAYVVFHDATLLEMAKHAPQNLAALGDISGVGAKKLERYGEQILQVLKHADQK